MFAHLCFSSPSSCLFAHTPLCSASLVLTARNTPPAVNEIQQLTCRADNGSFMLSFRENVTLPIHWNSTLVEFKHRLEQIFTYVHENATLLMLSNEAQGSEHSPTLCHVFSGSVLSK